MQTWCRCACRFTHVLHVNVRRPRQTHVHGLFFWVSWVPTPGVFLIFIYSESWRVYVYLLGILVLAGCMIYKAGALTEPATVFFFGWGELHAGSQPRVPRKREIFTDLTHYFLGWTQIHFRKKAFGSFRGGGEAKDMMSDDPPSWGLGSMAGLPPWIRQ